MRVGIIGAGALGCLFGGFLSNSGVDVEMTSHWEEHIETINEEGLLIESKVGSDRRVYPTVRFNPVEIGEVDVAFLFVKCKDTAQALEDCDPMIGPDTTVITLQNGLKNKEMVANHVEKSQILAGVTSEGANRIGPGHIIHTGAGESTLGGGDRESAEQIVSLMNRAGFESTVVDDPEPHIWNSQFVSVGIKPVAALTTLRDGPMVEYPPTRHVMEQLVREAVEVARVKDIEILHDDPVEHLLELCRTIHYDSKSSILEDIENNRKTEIEYINGVIVDYGKQHDIPVTYNEMGTKLVQGKEQSYL